MSNATNTGDIDPTAAEILEDLRRAFAAGKIDYIAVITVGPDGSSRRLYGCGNLETVIGALEAAKAIVMNDILERSETISELVPSAPGPLQ